MNFHILTLFPEMIENTAMTSILGRAIEKGTINVSAVNIRDYTQNKHNKVDDYTYGGGAGMLMQAQPVYDAYQAVADKIGRKARVIYMTPQGQVFNQRMAEEFAREEDLVFLCGHYEGIDERVLEEIVTDYVSIGDYVLTGGELPAMVMIDAIARLVPDVLHNEDSAETESFSNYLLEYPQYSRPQEWHGKTVPEVLMSGDHKKIAAWRLEESIKRTKERRPDLYVKYEQMRAIYERLYKKKLLHMMMLESINAGTARVCAISEEGVLLEDMKSATYMLSATSKEAGAMLLAQLPEADQIALFVSHQHFLNPLVEEKTQITAPVMKCVQAVYTRGVRLPERKDIEIKCLDESYLSFVMEHYEVATGEEYIAERLQTGNIYGAFKEGVLTGFIGVHAEGSMGILVVLPEYRKQGIAVALESYLINRLLEKGKVPFCQIIVDNEPSVCLQQKLGLAISKENLYWYIR
ncbi:MAG: tRNA (guanosine(37)-N1)-methyltransferase TrmD [Lachnospiraceae bacterium]|nr:tRNA (guanosine(37)-N1)-methyltransferase TrmD [Lachnospiraceae bacterium]